MKKTKSTKRALLSAILALVMTVSMLVGTTFAWFTDSVTSSGNKIVAGNLDVELYLYNGSTYENISHKTEPLFGENGLAHAADGSSHLWEPGKTQVAYLAIRNAGNLSLKYKISLNVTDIQEKLNEVVTYTVTPDARGDIDEKRIDAWDGSNDRSVVLGEQVVSESDVPMGADSWHYFALSVHMMEEAGNEYMNGSINFDLTVLATQLGDDDLAEDDSFGNGYDKESPYPNVTSGVFNSRLDDDMHLTIGDVTAIVPKGSLDGVYTLQVESVEITEDEDGKVSMDCEIDLTRNGESVNNDHKPYIVNIEVEHMSHIHSVTHKGVKIDENDFDYNPFTGVVSFKTESFSPFSVKYEQFGTHVEFDAEKEWITAGDFRGVDPATIAANLDGDDENAEYVVLDYVKDGETHYVVTHKATTVILAAGEATLNFEHANANSVTLKTGMSGNLFKVFNKDHGGFGHTGTHHSVFLLPGTYTEATTVYIHDDALIMGLGDTEDIKLVKASSSNSNRHLLNVTKGSYNIPEGYIEVTIKNLYLDAKANTTGNKDNAAVQSITCSKVKCYDLIIEKNTGWSSVAFYVNGNQSDNRGAYLYVENCSIIGAANTYNVVSTAYPYTFWYQDLTYGKTAETMKSYTGSKAVYLPYDNWDWKI